MARTLSDYANDVRFLGDAVAYLRQALEAAAAQAPEETFTEEPNAQLFEDVEGSALVMNRGAQAPDPATGDGGKNLCLPPGPCDSPTGSTLTFLGKLNHLFPEVLGRTERVLQELQRRQPAFSAAFTPGDRLLRNPSAREGTTGAGS